MKSTVVILLSKENHLELNNANMLLEVVLSSSMWTGLYICLCWKWSNRSCEWLCRLISMGHALLVTALSYYCTFVQGPWPFTDPGGPNTDLQEQIVIISIGYFIFDFCWCVYFQTEGPAMLCHHFISIFTLGISLLTGFYGTEVVATIFGSEVTNPLLQSRWFLKKSGYYESIIGNVVDVLFVLIFTYVRIVVGSYLLYCYLTMSHIPKFMKVASFAFYVVSCIFWITILRFAHRKCLSKYRHHKTALSADGSNSKDLSRRAEN